MVDVQVGKSYRNGYGKTVKITEKIDPLDTLAGYSFRDEHGRYYSSYGDHNDGDLSLVEEVHPIIEVDKLRNGNYCVTVGGEMILRDQNADRVIQWLLDKVNP